MTEYFFYNIVVSLLIIIFVLLLPPEKNEPIIEKANLAFILVMTQFHCHSSQKEFEHYGEPYLTDKWMEGK